MAYFNEPNLVFINRENKTAFVIDTAVFLNPSTFQYWDRKNYEILKFGPDVRYIWKLNSQSLYSLVISTEGVVTRNFVKCVKITGLTKNILRMGQKAVLLQMYLIVCIYLGHTRWSSVIVWLSSPWQPNPTNSLGYVKVSAADGCWDMWLSP
jgi:hypothetical protein